MVDNLKQADRQKTMRAVKSCGTTLEKSFFSMLAGMGVNGWRKNAKNVFGKPDVVFDEKRVAIFIDGCFWHGCPFCKRKFPDTNRRYWFKKIRRNRTRAKIAAQELKGDGWAVLRIWEHELKGVKDKRGVRRIVRRLLDRRANIK